MERYYFDRTTDNDNAADLRLWLSRNAADYFDSIDGDDESAYVECTVGERAKLAFTIGAAAIGSLVLRTERGGTIPEYCGSINSIGYGVAIPRFEYAIKTNNGIFLYGNSGHTIMITKSDRDTTSVYMRWRGCKYLTSYQASPNVDAPNFPLWFAADLINDSTISYSNVNLKSYATSLDGHNYFAANLSTLMQENYMSCIGNNKTGLTSLVNMCFIGGTYAPNMFVTPYSQYRGQIGAIVVDGVRYVYDGYVALKE